jgi:hypothetical protein
MAPSPDGKKLYVDGFDNRGELMRYDPHSHQFVQNLGGGAGFLARREMGDLRFLSRSVALGLSRRWKRQALLAQKVSSARAAPRMACIFSP